MPIGNSNFLQALGWAVLNSLWQMAFLWIIFQVILSFGNYRSAFKSKMATVLLSAGFSWFLFTLISHWIIDPNSIKRSLLAIGSFQMTNAAWNDQLQTFLPYASIAYLLLLLIPTIQFIRNYRFVQALRTTGLSKCHVDLRIFVQRFGERMGIHKTRTYLCFGSHHVTCDYRLFETYDINADSGTNESNAKAGRSSVVA
jgi:hypothetical protein